MTIWFHNHGHKTSRRGGDKKVPKVRIPREKNTRALQEIEIYSKKYYKKHVKPAVKVELKRLKSLRPDNQLPPEDRLEVVRRFTQEHYDNDTPEVRAWVLAEAAQEKERVHALAQAHKKGTVIDIDAERTPEEYQQCVSSPLHLIIR